jgi:hypothetical protein
MERAAALLRDTDEPVGAICKGVGLRSVGSFTTSFGRAFGVSPAAYRVSRRRAAVAAMPPCVLPVGAAARRAHRPRAACGSLASISRMKPPACWSASAASGRNAQKTWNTCVSAW